MPRTRGWRRALWRTFSRLPKRAKAGVVVLCAVLLAAAGFGAYRGYEALFPGTCASGGSTYLLPSGPTGDCVGYTSGDFVFDPALAAVEHDIQREDQQVTAEHPHDYVSVVMLLPISGKDGSIMSMQTVLSHLRGAYTAQHYANRNDVNGIRPYIQILIGNLGYQGNQWSTATSIIRRDTGSQHIAAVTGLGVSLATTEDAAKSLTAAGIPVIGSSISSDNFDDIRDLIRVSPSNKDEVAAANAYAGARFGRAILIDDDNNGDIYDSTLVRGFERFQDSTHKIVGLEAYDTSYRDQPNSAQQEQQGDDIVRNRISQMTTNICAAQPAVVLFAGRGRDLTGLVSDLGSRPCLEKKITIITGDDVVNMADTPQVQNGLESGVSVDYAGVANQDEWSSGSSRAIAEGHQGFSTFSGAFGKLFPGVPVSDENLLMSYDSVLTAISAIRLSGQRQPEPYAVAAELPSLQGQHAVLGTSGPLAFSADWRNPLGSNPVGKAVPLLRFGADGKPRFLTITWPDGKPPSY